MTTLMDGEPPPKALEEIRTAVVEAQKLLRNKHPAVQASILAELVAMFLAGHFENDDTGEVDENGTVMLREQILRQIVCMVRNLMPGWGSLMLEKRNKLLKGDREVLH